MVVHKHLLWRVDIIVIPNKLICRQDANYLSPGGKWLNFGKCMHMVMALGYMDHMSWLNKVYYPIHTHLTFPGLFGRPQTSNFDSQSPSLIVLLSSGLWSPDNQQPLASTHPISWTIIEIMSYNQSMISDCAFLGVHPFVQPRSHLIDNHPKTWVRAEELKYVQTRHGSPLNFHDHWSRVHRINITVFI